MTLPAKLRVQNHETHETHERRGFHFRVFRVFRGFIHHSPAFPVKCQPNGYADLFPCLSGLLTMKHSTTIHDTSGKTPRSKPRNTRNTRKARISFSCVSCISWFHPSFTCFSSKVSTKRICRFVSLLIRFVDNET